MTATANNSLEPTTPAPRQVMPLAFRLKNIGARKSLIGYDYLCAGLSRKRHAVARLGVAAQFGRSAA